jgi:hypothetical protein
MRRAFAAVAACGAMLAANSPAASAAVDRMVYRCEGTGSWQVSVNLAGQSTATRSITAPTGSCKKVYAGIADDGNFTLRSFDTGDSAGGTGPGATMIGVGVTGVPAFAGVMTGGSTLVRGPIVIAGDSLNATLTAADATPWTVTEIHAGNGSCGLNCYRTKAVWIGTYAGTE